MKKTQLAICLLLAFSSLASAAGPWINESYATGQIWREASGSGSLDASSPFFSTGFTAAYRTTSILAAGAVIVLAALAYFAGYMFESENLKSWGRMELTQALATAVLVAVFLGVIESMNVMLEQSAKTMVSPCGEAWDYATAKEIVNGNPSGPSLVPPGSPRAMQYAVCYLKNLQGIAQFTAGGETRKSVEFAAMAYENKGIQTTNWIFFYIGGSYRPNAEKRLDSEMAGIKADMANNMLIGLAAQRFLVGTIAAVLGPLCLLIGIILRAFAFTRKAGGLLMAIAIALLIILPAAYLLAWISLVVSVYGNDVVGAGSPDDKLCPAECKIQPAVAYEIVSGKPMSMKDFASKGYANAAGQKISYKNPQEMFEKGLQTCYPSKNSINSSISAETSERCPTACRELPYPYYAGCNDEAECGRLPQQCKIIRAMDSPHPTKPGFGWCAIWDDEEGIGCKDACTDICRNRLPQINYTDGESGDGNPYNQISVTANSCSACTSCPMRCREYDITSGKLLRDASDPVCKRGSAGATMRCDACYGQFDNGNKSCFTGISSLASDDSCNSPQVCGPPKSIKDDAQERYDFCPIECRVIFENYAGGTDYTQYIDKLYRDKCLDKDKYLKPCQKCWAECKVNATKIPGIGATAANSIAVPPAGNCSAPPKFNQNPPYDMITKNCAFCPVPCRLVNPSPFDVYRDVFMSRSDVNITCTYSDSAYATTVDLPNGNTQDGCREEQEKYGYNTSMDYAEYSYAIGIELDKTDSSGNRVNANTCAPFKRGTPIYELVGYTADTLCPRYSNVSGVRDGTPGHPQVPGNTHAARECYEPGIENYCVDGNCSDATCKSNWPGFCTPENAGNLHEGFKENKLPFPRGCALCKDRNPPQYTKGPQCQVKLVYEDQNKVRTEKNPRCHPDCYDKNKCNSNCFPTIELPNTSTCGEFFEQSLRDEVPEFANWDKCGACPYECRYDYDATPPQNLGDYCGVNLLADLKKRIYLPPNWQPDPNQKYWICEDRANYNYCNNTLPQDKLVINYTSNPAYLQGCIDNGYSCKFRANTEKYWQCVVYDNNNKYYLDHPCAGHFLLDQKHPKDPNTCGGATDWYRDGNMCPTTWKGQSVTIDCGYDGNQWGYLYDGGNCEGAQASDFFECKDAYVDPYPGLNKFLNYSIEVTVCGNITSIENPGPNAPNWCGKATNPDTNDEVASCDMALCTADYASSTIKTCLAASLAPPPGTPPGSENCVACPTYCRVYEPPTPSPMYCSGKFTFLDQYLNCDMGNCVESCRLNSSANLSIAPPPGNPPTDCHVPASGRGKFCPARCRIAAQFAYSDKLFGCDSPDYDCNELAPSCKAQVPEKLCEACSECETDCLSLPYVRQACEEVCINPEPDIMDMDPGSLLSAWKGGRGDPANRAIGALGIAAVLLPMFAIIICLAFIRVLSPLLGGDIEIPGLMRFL